ncbi:DNA repair protein [Pseudozyma hubeiensis SY62]|uniref:DNA-(apurinic or apyrimidinic site) lyase n=1 Tax=Pseudozyma hubeiensis (strain SY62) TaxID=1305764 RepID=R9P6F9_PSEHS|nr:DNA repair protein [Pseudozyma hubeiensis SY62]GAC96941.1 DNA repair protein [Pseudozyma hubeiensis SY62]
MHSIKPLLLRLYAPSSPFRSFLQYRTWAASPSARRSSSSPTFVLPLSRPFSNMPTSHKLAKPDKLSYDDPEHADFFGPRPPPGYSSLRAAASQILLPLTVSNKCGQAFRWRRNKVWQPLPASTTSANGSGAPHEEQIEWSLCLSDRVVLLRQDEHRGFIYHRTLLPSSDDSESTNMEASGETVRWLTDYLSLDVPLESLYAEWSEKDPVFARFATRFSGLRMLRQDPWECLCAFVCSSNNNIARIGQMVQNLCTHFSPVMLEHSYPAPPPAVKVEEGDAEQGEVRIAFHPFPPPEALAKPGVEEKLRELGFGYRAKYLARTAQMLCEQHGGDGESGPIREKLAQHLDEKHWLYGIKPEEDFRNQQLSPPLSADEGYPPQEPLEPARKRVRQTRRSTTKSSPDATSASAPEPAPARFTSVRSYLQHLRTLAYRSARDHLIQFPGVGPKVADCILLMSLDQASSIPVDRHVFQFAEKWYKLRTKKYEDIADYFRDLWGDYAGWAHSVLFTADLRSFADYNKGIGKKEEKVESGGGEFWGDGEGAGYMTPPSSQSVVKEEMEEKLQAVHSPPRMAIPELVPQSLKPEDQEEGATLAERIKSRPKRKSRLSEAVRG